MAHPSLKGAQPLFDDDIRAQKRRTFVMVIFGS